MISREGDRTGDSATPAMQQVFPPNTDPEMAVEAGLAGEMPEVLNHDAEADLLGERFFETVFRAAAQSGCELLFEIPAALFGDPAFLSAAMRSQSESGSQLFFVLFNTTNGAVRIMEEGEVGESVLDFTRSYASVLGLIASDRRLVTPLLQ